MLRAAGRVRRVPGGLHKPVSNRVDERFVNLGFTSDVL
jgi:hypothetical protein